MAGNGMGVTRFEDLAGWRKARGLASAIYRITGYEPFMWDFGLRNQIQRAAVSVMSNIAEGFERYSNREFAHYLSIARGSLAEVRSQLYVALDMNYIGQDEFESLKEDCLEIQRILGGLRKSLTK